MKSDVLLRVAVGAPLLLSLALCGAAHSLRQRTAANVRECAACAKAAESLAPYLAQIRAYDAVKSRLRASAAEIPVPRLGVPPAERATERGAAMDGWVAVRETYSWTSLKTGQAFAVLESFSSAEVAPWRMASLRLEALPDGENASLSVTLERAEPEPRRE